MHGDLILWSATFVICISVSWRKRKPDTPWMDIIHRPSQPSFHTFNHIDAHCGAHGTYLEFMKARQSAFPEEVPSEAEHGRSRHLSQCSQLMSVTLPGGANRGTFNAPFHPFEERRCAPSGHFESLLQHDSPTSHRLLDSN